MRSNWRYHQTDLAETTKKRLNIIKIQCMEQELCMLLDTGAPQSSIRVDSAQRLNLATDNDFIELPELKLGAFVWEGVKAHPDKREYDSTEYFGCSLDGVLGTDVMNGLCWLFDRPSRKVHICDTEHAFCAEWSKDAAFISTRPHVLGDSSGHVWATEAYLNGHGPIHTDLDTGAQRTIITSKAGALLDPSAPRTPIQLSNGGEVTNVSSYRTRAKSLKIAGITFSNPVVAVCDPIFSVDPPLLERQAILLGIDIIGENSYGFDLKNGLFWIFPSPS